MEDEEEEVDEEEEKEEEVDEEEEEEEVAGNSLLGRLGGRRLGSGLSSLGGRVLVLRLVRALRGGCGLRAEAGHTSSLRHMMRYALQRNIST